jgi:putative copper export protein
MKKDRSTKNTHSRFSTAACFGIALLATSGEINAQDIVEEQAATGITTTL